MEGWRGAWIFRRVVLQESFFQYNHHAIYLSIFGNHTLETEFISV